MGGQRFDLRVVGVGGQGVVGLSTAIARAAARQGLTASAIDRPRSAMRLGPITCDLRFGDSGAASFITSGDADAVLALEPLDGVLNAAWLLKKDGFLLLNAAETPTIEELVSGKRDARRDDWLDAVEQRGAAVLRVDAAKEAVECGSDAESGGYFLLGVLCASAKGFPVSPQAIREELAGQTGRLTAFEGGLRFA